VPPEVDPAPIFDVPASKPGRIARFLD